MKKLLIAAFFMFGFAGLASAQAVKKSAPAKVVKMEKAKPAAKVKKAQESPGMPTDEQIKKSSSNSGTYYCESNYLGVQGAYSISCH